MLRPVHSLQLASKCEKTRSSFPFDFEWRGALWIIACLIISMSIVHAGNAPVEADAPPNEDQVSSAESSEENEGTDGELGGGDDDDGFDDEGDEGFDDDDDFDDEGFEEEDDLSDLSLQDLMEVEVTSVKKKKGKLKDSPAAIFVITNEDIKRSGVRTLPEALRMVPGMMVTKMESSRWAITARGFNTRFANKLLVLIDGRSVYTPLFSGVYWGAQDLLLEDVERIEVIRGPGGALWGANAVNGVINIITKSSEKTQGTFAEVGGGTHERFFSSLRYGGRISDNATYRAYMKFADREAYELANNLKADDAWNSTRGGFRVDWKPSDEDSIMAIGDVFYLNQDVSENIPTLTAPYTAALDTRTQFLGSSFLTRWDRSLSETSGLSFQFYYEHYDRDTYHSRQIRDTFDFEAEHQFQWGERHEINWGLNLRYWKDHIDQSGLISFDPISEGDTIFSLFVQDDIKIAEDLFTLTLGSKFEYNDYTKFEVQPSARFLLTPHENHTVWGAVSRAVRTPSRSDHTTFVVSAVRPPTAMTGFLPVQANFTGDKSFDSEDLYAFEMGYRTSFLENLSFDITGFFNRYENLRSLIIGSTSFSSNPVNHLDLPTAFDNDTEADAFGVEMASSWKPLKWWTITAAYTFFTLDLRTENRNAQTLAGEDHDPEHQIVFRSSINLPFECLPGKWEFDTWLYYTDALQVDYIGSTLKLDARLSWQATENVEFTIVGQNLLERQQREGLDDPLYGIGTEVPRGVYASLTLRF